MSDFRKYTKYELAKTLCDHVGDFEDQGTRDKLTVDYFLGEVDSGRAVIDADEFAVAVVYPEGWRENAGNAILWLLFVQAQCRSSGHGRKLVERLRSAHSHKLPMVLACNGENRVRFFKTCGFIIKEDNPAGTIMIASMNAMNDELLPITLWYRQNEKGWGYNHLEDGHSQGQNPTPKLPNQEKTWARGTWHGELTWITKDTPGRVVYDSESQFYRTLLTSPLVVDADEVSGS